MLTHKGTQDIPTQRLLLRRFRPEDAGDMYKNWATDPDVTRYLTWDPHESPEESRRVIAGWLERYSQPDYYQWALVLRDSGEVMGSVGVVDASDRHEWAEIGYCIARPLWGQGIMTEAVCAVRDYLFIEIGYNRIQAKHDAENPASGRVMVKAGMQYEGTLKQYWRRSDGGFADMSVYSITQAEYNA